MTIFPENFKPSVFATLLTVLSVLFFVRMGFWQLDRAAEKREVIDDFVAATEQPPTTLLVALYNKDKYRAQHTRAVGRWLPASSLLLDNQTRDHVQGVRVWNWFETAETVILIDRGWVANDELDDALKIPLPKGKITIDGIWRVLPEAGWRVNNNLCDSDYSSLARANMAARLTYPSYKELKCALDTLAENAFTISDRSSLAEGLLLMDDFQPNGFERNWEPTHIDARKHLAYALQWFAFALTAFILFISLNKKPKDAEQQ